MDVPKDKQVCVTPTNGWDQYQRLVMDKLNTHDVRLDSIFDRLGNIDKEIAGLKVRAGVWGFLAGAVPSLGAILTLLLLRMGG